MKKSKAFLNLQDLFEFCIKVILPLLFGALIYIFYRPKNLLMFDWLNFLGFKDSLNSLRPTAQQQFSRIPEWVIYSLPDGLWVLSYTFLMSLIWASEQRIIKPFFIFFGLIFSLSLELGQYFKIIPGNFDFNDLIFINLGFLIPYLYEKHRAEKN